MSQLANTTETGLQAFAEFESSLAKFKEKYEGKVYDLTDLMQNKEARSDSRGIGSLVARLDKRHAELKAPLKEQVDLLDGVRKTIRDELRGVQGGINDQLKAHEDKIAARKAILQGYVDALAIEEWFAECATTERTAHQIVSMIQFISEIEIDETYEERQEDATEAKNATLEHLGVMEAIAEKREADAAKLAQLQKEQKEREEKERIEKIRQDEEAKARIDAAVASAKKIDDAERATREAEERTQAAQNKSEREAIEAKAQIEFDKIEAERAAKEREERAAKDERERIEAEQREQQEREKERVVKEIVAKSKVSHRKKIRRESLAGLISAGYCDADAAGIIELIDSGAIPHVVLNY